MRKWNNYLSDRRKYSTLHKGFFPYIKLLHVMLKLEAENKIRQYIPKQPQLITPKGSTFDDHVKWVTEQLFKNVIVPVKSKVTSTCVNDGDFEKYAKANVWAIARRNDSWLLTIDGQPEFALAFGTNPSELKMHGFSSSDVLAEWCA